MKQWMLLATVVLLTGCAATPYQPMEWNGGYSETQLSEDLVRIDFNGNGYTDRATVADYALLRCAEYTLERGARYFVIIDQNSYSSYSTATTPSTTTGQMTSYGNTTYGSSTTFGGHSYNVAKPSSQNMILIFKRKPPGFSFDAEFLSNSLKTKYGIK